MGYNDLDDQAFEALDLAESLDYTQGELDKLALIIKDSYDNGYRIMSINIDTDDHLNIEWVKNEGFEE